MTDHSRIPDKPALEGLESVWGDAWEREGVFRFDRHGASRDTIYSIDTPPPTASGSLHIGHVFSFTHTDLVARYQRMRGRHVFYPMGWDDNGLPTERRVQNYYGVRCDPSLPYDPDFVPPFEGGDNKSTKAADQQPISRRNFIELCERLTVEDEQQFEALFRHARALGGLDADVPHHRRRGDLHVAARVRAQRRARRGLSGARAHPVGRDFRTAVAQAELEDREQPGQYHRVAFHRPGRRDDRDRDQPSRAHPGVRRPRRASRRRALPAPVRHHGDARPCSASRCRWSRTTSPRRTRAPASR